MTKSTAILFFSLNASDEAKAKKFCHNSGQLVNQTIAQKLIQKTSSTINKTGLPVFSFFSESQSGNCFGERLANALESVYEGGYQKIIVIGNDSPTITKELLLDAERQLTQHDFVLGPTFSGGLFLIGLDKNCYNREAFVGLAWQQVKLLESFKDYIQKFRTSAHWLKAHQDINNPAALKQFLLIDGFNAFRNVLVSCLATYLHSFKLLRSDHIVGRAAYRAISLRAPPVSI